MPSPQSFGKTPESNLSGLRRKDSKHALTTCHGITGNGRACRRPLAGSGSPSAERYAIKGAMLMPRNHEDPAVFFCWQHKDQADLMRARDVDVVEVQERTSLETVFRNLGLEEVDEEEEDQQGTPSPSPANRQRNRRESGTQSSTARAIPRTSPKRTSPSPRQRPKDMEQLNSSRLESPTSDLKQGFLASLFGCVVVSRSPTAPLPPRQPRRRKPDDGAVEGRVRVPSREIPIERTIRASKASTVQQAKAAATQPSDSKNRSSPRRDSGVGGMRRKKDKLRVYQDPTPSSAPGRPNLTLHAHSEPLQPLANKRPDTNRSVSAPERHQISKEWMPELPAGSTDTMRLVYAKLLVAMSESPTKKDAEGYIYMFWQTDEKQTDAETSAAASIVGGARRQSQSQRAQEAVLEQRFFQPLANMARSASKDRTIFLKIGRAANVHQRMAQWQAQCGYNVSLLRYYPHSAAEESVKVRYVGKVERLVHLHLEMLGKRFNRECRCGTEHKEWFQVDANPKEVRAVDDIIQQWVAWCDGKFGVAAG